MLLSEPPADSTVPRFSDELEAEMAESLAERLGETPTAEDLDDYRTCLYAFAVAFKNTIDAEEATRRHAATSPPPPCPPPPSTPGSRRSRTTGKS